MNIHLSIYVSFLEFHETYIYKAAVNMMYSAAQRVFGEYFFESGFNVFWNDFDADVITNGEVMPLPFGFDAVCGIPS